MTHVTTFDEQRLAELLGALPPAPDAWVQAAKELPLARRQLDNLVERAVADDDFRRAIEADIEAAIREAGCVPDPVTVAALRARLDRP
ncbi:hypothetical protein BH18ACT14_BH18ACT14_15130 [soil metagenome]